MTENHFLLEVVHLTTVFRCAGMGCLSSMETLQADVIILAGGSHPGTIGMYVRDLPTLGIYTHLIGPKLRWDLAHFPKKTVPLLTKNELDTLL